MTLSDVGQQREGSWRGVRNDRSDYVVQEGGLGWSSLEVSSESEYRLFRKRVSRR